MFILENVQMSLDLSQYKSKRNPRKINYYGYDIVDEELVVNEEEKRILEFIVNTLIENKIKSKKQLENDIREFATTSPLNRAWSFSTVREVLFLIDELQRKAKNKIVDEKKLWIAISTIIDIENYKGLIKDTPIGRKGKCGICGRTMWYVGGKNRFTCSSIESNTNNKNECFSYRNTASKVLEKINSLDILEENINKIINTRIENILFFPKNEIVIIERENIKSKKDFIRAKIIYQVKIKAYRDRFNDKFNNIYDDTLKSEILISNKINEDNIFKQVNNIDKGFKESCIQMYLDIYTGKESCNKNENKEFENESVKMLTYVSSIKRGNSIVYKFIDDNNNHYFIKKDEVKTDTHRFSPNDIIGLKGEVKKDLAFNNAFNVKNAYIKIK